MARPMSPPSKFVAKPARCVRTIRSASPSTGPTTTIGRRAAKYSKTFAGITKTSAFEMKFTWLITFLVDTQGGSCTGIALSGPASVASSTIFVSPAGGEASVAATFDFVPNTNLIDVFLNGVRLEVGTHYVESGPPLALPQGGGTPSVSKGINFQAFTLNAGDRVFSRRP